MKDIFTFHEEQPEPLRKLIGPIRYAKRLERAGIAKVHGFNIEIIKPWAIHRINAELWIDSHNPFKSIFWGK